MARTTARRSGSVSNAAGAMACNLDKAEKQTPRRELVCLKLNFRFGRDIASARLYLIRPYGVGVYQAVDIVITQVV